MKRARSTFATLEGALDRRDSARRFLAVIAGPAYWEQRAALKREAYAATLQKDA
jgi:hypothetical protein